jgi:hypothetical protein
MRPGKRVPCSRKGPLTGDNRVDLIQDLISVTKGPDTWDLESNGTGNSKSATTRIAGGLRKPPEGRQKASSIHAPPLLKHDLIRACIHAYNMHADLL